jgi:hypothetical protein
MYFSLEWNNEYNKFNDNPLIGWKNIVGGSASEHMTRDTHRSRNNKLIIR